MQNFKDILVDPTGTVNLLADWDKGEIQLLQHHARQTLSMLEDISSDHFADVFLRDLTAGVIQYDEYSQ